MTKKTRYTVPDLLRGGAILCMVAYHTMWDLVFLHGVDFPWFLSPAARTFQMAIRWSFILISGFCWSMGKTKWKRGLIVLGCSGIISAVTALFMPDSIILFGVLTLLGVGMLATVPLDRFTKKISPYVGLILCILLFFFTLNVEHRTLGFGDLVLFDLPDTLYANHFTAFFGFYPKGFFSTDYVPVLPWLFLYWVGYFLYRIVQKHGLLKYLSAVSFPPLEWIGRRSLIIYMLHQPIIYGVLYVLFAVIR